MNKKEIKEGLKVLSDELQPREKYIMELRYGLNKNKAHTLEEIGKQFNITRERVRQIEAFILVKIKYSLTRGLTRKKKRV